MTCSFQPFSLSEGTKKRVFKKGVKHKVKLSETPPSSNLLPSPQPPPPRAQLRWNLSTPPVAVLPLGRWRSGPAVALRLLGSTPRWKHSPQIRLNDTQPRGGAKPDEKWRKCVFQQFGILKISYWNCTEQLLWDLERLFKKWLHMPCTFTHRRLRLPQVP